MFFENEPQGSRVRKVIESIDERHKGDEEVGPPKCEVRSW